MLIGPKELMESIELVARRHLNVQNVQVSTPGTNICRLIVEDVIKYMYESILSCWETIAHYIPTSTRHIIYSVVLL